ncbi:hypothetical protein [Mucilaginibacter sp.]|uniref:hypothetical protein n=1 Tax=Mucilaginibacter sp. TaxID=1882438 RepID=UPI003D0F9966
MKQALSFSVNVWLTTAILGMRFSMLIKICMDNHPSLNQWPEIFATAKYDIPVSLVGCFPSYLLFALATWVLAKPNSNIVKLKLLLTLIGVVLSIVPFLLILTNQLLNINYLPDLLPELIGYSIVTVAAIWLYKVKLPKADTVEIANFNDQL